MLNYHRYTVGAQPDNITYVEFNEDGIYLSESAIHVGKDEHPQSADLFLDGQDVIIIVHKHNGGDYKLLYARGTSSGATIPIPVANILPNMPLGVHFPLSPITRKYTYPHEAILIQWDRGARFIEDVLGYLPAKEWAEVKQARAAIAKEKQ